MTGVGIEDRAIGALVGLAVGDALGTTVEFRARDSYEHLVDMVGGGPFQLAPGEWTDDTAMALALADSLLACDGFDERDLLNRFVNWWRWGEYSCNGRCFDIGITTENSLRRWLQTGAIYANPDPRAAGNGSLMRFAPTVIRYWHDPTRLREVAGRQSMTTHAAPEAVDACIAMAMMLAEAIGGASKDHVLRPRDNDLSGEIGLILKGTWRSKSRDQIQSSGYVAHTLEAAMWCVNQTVNFRDAVLLAANLGDDADTTAAVTGQLAGALYGRSGIPGAWCERLAMRSKIESFAQQLIERSLDRGRAAN